MSLTIDFCGERYDIADGRSFTIGRNADLVVDDNPFLHRLFLKVSQRSELWWIANVGSQLCATVADGAGIVQAWLAPGAQIPVVFPHSEVWFTAGPTTYEFDIFYDDASFTIVPPEEPIVGTTTRGRTTLTPEQRLLLIALCEPLLKKRVRGAANTPSSADAAARLGWSLTKFNRKLDYLCQKLERLGVRGLHGGPERLATDRKSRLVEYAVSTRMVQPDDLQLLEIERVD